MIKIPPAVLSLLIGLILGAFVMWMYIDTKQVEADVAQVVEDNKDAEEIAADTVILKETNTVTKVVTKWKNKIVKIPRDLTNEEIDTLCANTYVPDDIMQSIRHEVAEARKRLSNL